MMTLAAEKRDPEVKAKKLRREGYSTGVLYGREMKENVSLKYTEKDALNFIKKAKEGAQTMLDISGEKVDALVKNIDYDPLSKKILALDFQALVAGEVVAATVPVTFINEEVVQGVFEPEITEIHYKADPAHLLDPIEIDLAKLPQGTRTLYVKDLKLEEKGVTVTTTADSQLFHIGEYLGSGPQLAADLVAVNTRKHQVQKKKIRMKDFKFFQCLFAVVDNFGFKTFLCKI